MIYWVCDPLFTHHVCPFPLLAFFFFCFLSCCSFGIDFNSPFWSIWDSEATKYTLGNIISKGWWSTSRDDDYSSTSFSPAVCDSECCHSTQTRWLILTVRTRGMTSFSACSLTDFKLALPLFIWKDQQQFLWSWTHSFEQNLVLPIFYERSDFFGWQIAEHWAFLRGTWPEGVHASHSCAAPTCWSRKSCVGNLCVG